MKTKLIILLTIVFSACLSVLGLTACGSDMKVHVHEYYDTLTYDETSHWYDTKCGCDAFDKEAHNFSACGTPIC